MSQSKGEQVEEEEVIGAVEYYDSLQKVRRKPNTRLGAATYLVEECLPPTTELQEVPDPPG